MRIHLDPTSREPIYRQIVEQIRLQAARGDLAEGERLPSVRELAVDLRINPNTAARAYRELEQEGVVVLQQGRGVFVTPRPKAPKAPDRRRILRPAIDDLLLKAWEVGIRPDQVVEEVRDRATELFEIPAEETLP